MELGDKFTVYSKERIIYYPVYGSKMIHGVLEVIEAGDIASYTNVLMAYDESNLSVLLPPYQEVTEPLSVNSGNRFIEGYIVATNLDKMGFEITDILYIDKGRENVVHAGDIFEVYYIPEIEKKTCYQIGTIGL